MRMRSVYCLSFLLVALPSCSTPLLVAKPELIRPYREQDQLREPFEIPYLAKYEKGKKRLWYVAADHTDDIESSTFKTIQSAVQELKPQAVIIEGVEYTGIFSPPDHARYVREEAKRKFKGSSESSYAAWLALESGVPFVPGEPMDKDIARELSKVGYLPIDYYYFDLARVVPQWRRTKRVNSIEHFRVRAPKFIEGYFKDFSVPGSFDYGSFVRWYKKNSGKEFKFNEVDSDDFSPQVDKDPTSFNRIAHEVGMVRERHVLNLITMLLNRFDRVLVVYGGGHLVKERDALKDLLGKPVDQKPF